jgi:uncharacterized protein YecE (DUF72 family)
MAVIGTAGWSIPGTVAEDFPPEGSALERYSRRFDGVEINSSFHRSHRPSTWARWAENVPEDFRFAVKMPKAISHQLKLVGCEDLVDRFLAEAGALGDRLSILLLQLPPKLAFEESVALPFLNRLAERAAPARIACEPRHPSWFAAEVDARLAELGISRVAADPALGAAAAAPGGAARLRYWRLHGSPVMYRSSYDDRRIAAYAEAIAAAERAGAEAWCMFDNTASSAATGDALRLARRLAGDSARPW